MSKIKIKTALISVFDKTQIIEISAFLSKNGVRIISTGGTYNLLKNNGIDVVEVSDVTNFPEMMSGRLKTLHPTVHGGLLGRPEDAETMKKHQIEKIDLLITNLYPFEETLKSGASFEEVIEKIDIGGPAMLRSAAKNFTYTTVISKPSQYDEIKQELLSNNFCTSLDFRKKMASKVFDQTSFYDSIISSFFEPNNELKDEIVIAARKIRNLRYGENPHQNATLFSLEPSLQKEINFTSLGGKELSYNNICDAEAAFLAAKSFVTKEACCVIVKHSNPCGIAVAKSTLDAYTSALECDKTSAFGGIVAINKTITKELAILICEHFFEVIIAQSFESEALDIFSKKKNLRLLEANFNQKSQNSKTFKIMDDILLMQDKDSQVFDENYFIVQEAFSDFKTNEISFAFNCVRQLKSNAICICLNNKMISTGCGQTSRVDSTKIALSKVENQDLSSAILASDAFFPFSDNIDLIAKSGIKTIVAPSGSVRDEEVIQACKIHKINLIFAKSRHFKH